MAIRRNATNSLCTGRAQHATPGIIERPKRPLIAKVTKALSILGTHSKAKAQPDVLPSLLVNKLRWENRYICYVGLLGRLVQGVAARSFCGQQRHHDAMRSRAKTRKQYNNAGALRFRNRWQWLDIVPSRLF